MFGYAPHNIDLYKLALIHKSASLVLEDGTQINNERLEYLGDAVIESVTSDYLYIQYPHENEGFLTQLRSKVVSRQSLNSLAKAIGLDRHIISNANGSFTQKHIFGDAFEALMGAIYLDMGYDFTNRLLINNIYYKHLDIDEILHCETDYKSRLIEWAQKEHLPIEFSTRNDKESTSLRPLFYSKVIIGGVEVGHGVGDSKKEAEQRAAFSVSQGVSDEVGDSILDKVDKITPIKQQEEEQQQ
ncbi:MAG: ribonuclease III [Rikenellaceae bacterium]